ncbi:MAG: DUF4339 domain-containing protein, partial [Planctomycetaceae bacterium]|nr:DUF4339 domain-containing protein [Planctomycetaceae bacterium]
MSENWYFKLFGEQFGPVARQELDQLARIGKLTKTDLIRSESDQDWKPAGELIDFAQIPDTSLESGLIPMSTLTNWDDGAKRPAATAPPSESSSTELPSLDDIVIANESETDRQSVSLEQFFKQHSSQSFSLPNQNEESEGTHFELAETLESQVVDS